MTGVRNVRRALSPCLDTHVGAGHVPLCQHVPGQWFGLLFRFGMIDASNTRESNSAEVVT